MTQGTHLRLSEQIRVSVAVNGHIIVTAEPRIAFQVIRAIEAAERVDETTARLRANYDAGLDRLERIYRRTTLLILCSSALALALAVNL